MKVILGKKIGMSQAFDTESGELIPVTILDVSNNLVSKLLKDGDKISHIEIGKDKKKNANRVDLGNYKTIEFVPQFKNAMKIEGEISAEVGSEIKADLFSSGDIVDVIGTTKGKGFAGVMKRWGFKGGKRTHGQSNRERSGGSVGSGTTLGRIYKNTKMPGHMGNVKRTIKNLKIVDVDAENGLISVSGPIPGSRNSYVVIRESFWNKNK